MPVAIDHETDVVLTDEDMRNLVAAITRRRIVLGGAGAALYAATPALAHGQAATPVAMRQLTDRMGPVLLPEHPRRVIVEGNTTLGNILALGVKPIAASFNPNSLPTFLQDQVDGIADVMDLSANSIDIEKALTLQPDLIIALWGSYGDPWNLENVERMKEAVPATYAYEAAYRYEKDLKHNLMEVARALNMEERANDVMARYDQRAADLREAVLAAGFEDKPVSVIRVTDDGGMSIRVGTTESVVFRAAGIPQPEGQRTPEDAYIDISLERLNILNEAFAAVIYMDDTSPITPDEILADPLWQAVTPVREGRVIFVTSGIWNSRDILGAMAIMDDVETLLLPLAKKA